MSEKAMSDCAACTLTARDRVCLNPATGKGGKGCPTLVGKPLIQKAADTYRQEEVLEFARQASIQESECYANRDRRPFVLHPVKPRILEICEFSRKMGYNRLGLAFCAGLIREAALVEQIFQNQGFQVVSVICKAGAVPKEAIGLSDDQKVRVGPAHESMCNPVLQALVLNEAETDFNILLGLCVGHDSLFFKHAEAPVTVLAVKDRLTGHNPLAAVYTSNSYYSRLNVP
jgi:uncharacterized metal-binding protein